jgi:hypothetical protein
MNTSPSSSTDLSLDPRLDALFRRTCAVCGREDNLVIVYQSVERVFEYGRQKFLRVELVGDGEVLCAAHTGYTRHQKFVEKERALAKEREARKRIRKPVRR